MTDRENYCSWFDDSNGGGYCSQHSWTFWGEFAVEYCSLPEIELWDHCGNMTDCQSCLSNSCVLSVGSCSPVCAIDAPCYDAQYWDNDVEKACNDYDQY
jgi:hypothetical protein